MPGRRNAILTLLFAVFPGLACLGQGAQNATSDSVAALATPSVAVLLVADKSGGAATLATALAVRQNGVLLVAYRAVHNASAIQVRFKSGEVFDQVQLLGVDERRGVAALRITAGGLPLLPIAPSGEIRAGDAITAVGHLPGHL